MPRFPLLVCSLAYFALFFPTGCSNPGPAATVERFYEAGEAGEVQAVAELSSRSDGSGMGEEKAEALIQGWTEELRLVQGIESVDVLSEEIDGDVADVRVRLTYGNGETYEENFELVRIDGRWTINFGYSGRK